MSPEGSSGGEKLIAIMAIQQTRPKPLRHRVCDVDKDMERRYLKFIGLVRPLGMFA